MLLLFCLHLARLFQKWFAKRFSPRKCDLVFTLVLLKYVFFCGLFSICQFVFKNKKPYSLGVFGFGFPRMSKKRSPALGARVPPLPLLTVDSSEADASGGRRWWFWNLLFSLFALNFVIRFSFLFLYYNLRNCVCVCLHICLFLVFHFALNVCKCVYECSKGAKGLQPATHRSRAALGAPFSGPRLTNVNAANLHQMARALPNDTAREPVNRSFEEGPPGPLASIISDRSRRGGFPGRR